MKANVPSLDLPAILIAQFVEKVFIIALHMPSAGSGGSARIRLLIQYI